MKGLTHQCLKNAPVNMKILPKYFLDATGMNRLRSAYSFDVMHRIYKCNEMSEVVMDVAENQCVVFNFLLCVF